MADKGQEWMVDRLLETGQVSPIGQGTEPHVQDIVVGKGKTVEEVEREDIQAELEAWRAEREKELGYKEAEGRVEYSDPGIADLANEVNVGTEGAKMVEDSEDKAEFEAWKLGEKQHMRFVKQLSIVVLVLELGFIAAMLWLPLGETDGVKDWAQLVLGAFLAHLGTIINFWIGTSIGSVQKNGYIQRSGEKAVRQHNLEDRGAWG